MKLYLIKAKIKIGGDDSDFELTIEGDDQSAEDGDWSAAGPASPFLNSQDGSWTFYDSKYAPGTRYLWLNDGPEPGYINWLWRSVPHAVADLILPADFPKISAQTSTGSVRWGDRDRNIIWRLARRYF